MNKTGLGAAEKARWERLVMRRPGLVLPRLQRLMQGSQREPAVTRAALQGTFFVLERLGRAAELQDELEAALAQAERQRALAEAAELSEALGRLHYQRGDYNQACNAWSQTLHWAGDDSRSACLARIGLAHLCYALGEWARGGRVLEEAEAHYARLSRDAYLRAKIALNRAASLRATQGPQAALPALDEAFAAAREAGHRDYQAEAIWHHARCARDRGDTVLALRLAQEALALARACGYLWLEGQAALLQSELQEGEVALRHANEALALAETLQSRSLQALAHGRLADLMRERGELGPSWHHAQQSHRLEASMNQSQMPAGLEALARFDTDPAGADALLLELAGQAWTLESSQDFIVAWQRLLPRLLEGLGLSGLQLWWDEGGNGRFLPLLATGDAMAPLTAARVPGYLHALSAPGAPLLAADAASHPWRVELGEALAGGGRQTRLELGLRLDGRLVALLWLLREPGAAWPRADLSRAGRLAALLERLLAQLQQARQRQAAAAPTPHADEVAALAAATRQLQRLLQLEPLDRAALAVLAERLGLQAERLERALRKA
ncbi:hypothetical protein G8A07_20595 [Roseateles sp. DAIF2]|uniref:hypothetical protein n=1 Tax=Roseateles sp. DAIF2 TaxID=2714952 RepID=UPI0018A2E5E6|nr:hypothetical protein [Roseateles sp. DAIF2]QPF75076.1 hypothetical protein G8A07_20595 [Roseateles sp. DAIF2]